MTDPRTVKKTVTDISNPSYSYSNMMKTIPINNLTASDEPSQLQVPSKDEVENTDMTAGETAEIERTKGEEDKTKPLGIGSPAEDGPVTVEKLQKQIDDLFR